MSNLVWRLYKGVDQEEKRQVAYGTSLAALLQSERLGDLNWKLVLNELPEPLAYLRASRWDGASTVHYEIREEPRACDQYDQDLKRDTL